MLPSNILTRCLWGVKAKPDFSEHGVLAIRQVSYANSRRAPTALLLSGQ